MRRAALSITNNIAEGHGRWHCQENMRYCRIARGSIDEILDDLNVCLDEGYGALQQVEQRKQEGYELIKRVNGYIAYLRKTRQGQEE
jgi:four helix bundle protein